MTSEQDVWAGGPSQVINLGVYLVCGLVSLTIIGAVVAVPYACWRYLVVRNTRYELTTQRLKVHTGVLSKQTEELELYRVKDTRFEQSLLQRLFGVGNVVIISTDASTPVAGMTAIAEARSIREKLRHLVETRREQKGVRVTEFE